VFIVSIFGAVKLLDKYLSEPSLTATGLW